MPIDPPEIIPIDLRPGEPTVLKYNRAVRMRVYVVDRVWLEIILAANQDVTITNPVKPALPLRVDFIIEDELKPKAPKLVPKEEPGALE